MSQIELTPADLAGPRTALEARNLYRERQARLSAAADAARRERDEQARLQVEHQAAIAEQKREKRLKGEAAPALAYIAERQTWRAIANEVCTKRGLTFDEVISHSHLAYLMPCRCEIAYRIRAETDLSLPAIGERLGGRDHTTVLHRIKKHARLNKLPMPQGMKR